MGHPTRIHFLVDFRYFMFKELVPEYVIPRMLNKEVIADPRNTVTVLFVLINNFGEYTRTNRTGLHILVQSSFGARWWIV